MQIVLWWVFIKAEKMSKRLKSFKFAGKLPVPKSRKGNPSWHARELDTFRVASRLDHAGKLIINRTHVPQILNVQWILFITKSENSTSTPEQHQRFNNKHRTLTLGYKRKLIQMKQG